MIIVMLNAYTALEGSFYGKSVTTGDWDDFVDSELVEHINSHYRTVANRGSRGLAGHSMGGYGTGRLGMRRPDVYSSFYALRARYLDSGLGIRPTAEQVRAAPFGAKAQFALAAAFSPDPGNAPLFLDLPLKDGAPQPSVVAPCAPTHHAMLDQYLRNLRQLKAIAFDVELQDSLLSGSRQLDARLQKYKIPHIFETCEGTHTHHVADRIETKVLPFFSAQLKFESSK